MSPVSTQENQTLFLLPDSLAPTQCLAVTSGNRVWVNRLASRGALVRWLGSSLGPCAFYARFGVPSARIRSWLGARGNDVALAPMSYGAEAGFSTTWMFFGTPWQFLYGLPPVALACVAGRAADCATTIRSGDGAPTDAVGGLFLAMPSCASRESGGRRPALSGRRAGGKSGPNVSQSSGRPTCRWTRR